MSIQKVTGILKFTFMFDDRFTSVEEASLMSLEEIIADCSEEFMLGQFVQEVYEVTELSNEQVPAEEIALGRDGTFFADRDELEHARMNAEGEK